MTITAGIDVGSTYTKAVLMNDTGEVVSSYLRPTGFRLNRAASEAMGTCLEKAGLDEGDCAYIVSTGIGRHRVDFKDLAVTDLTAAARGAVHLFPGTRTVLDVGGQTMKAIRIDDRAKVQSFRLNDKCAAGTGAFIEKTARYMGYETDEIGPLMETSRSPVAISGVCAVFAESEVINHLSIGTAPSDIMQGALESLTLRSVQLMKRAKGRPEYTVIGGILRFSSMKRAIENNLETAVNVPEGDRCQLVCAIGASVLGHLRLRKLGGQRRPEPRATVSG